MVKILPKFNEINPLLNYRLVSVVVVEGIKMKIMVLLLVLLFDGITIVSYVINNTTYDSGRVSNLKFIGSHYFLWVWESQLWLVSYSLCYNDPLWAGQQCNGLEGPCCPANSSMPWFYRSLDTHTNDKSH